MFFVEAAEWVTRRLLFITSCDVSQSIGLLTSPQHGEVASVEAGRPSHGRDRSRKMITTREKQ